VEPTFLSLDDVLEIHSDQLGRYGGRDGVRDIDLLRSAVAQPRATFEGQRLHGDIFDMAAAYLFHIVQNHAFVDGNKRVGATASLVFLFVNGIRIQVDNDSFADMVLSVAQGMSKKPAIADFLRRHARKA